MMNIVERVVTFGCDGEQLLGILTGPKNKAVATGIGVLVVVGGPQYRAGSHRQFVLLARALAHHGHACFRFDYRGMGDSAGVVRSFEHVQNDIAAAIAALRAASPEVKHIVLWGLCDGASASLLFLHAKGRASGVDGLCLINPWVRSAETLARARVKHYYRDRLLQRSFWSKLLRGGVALKAASDLLRNLAKAVARGPNQTHTSQPAFPWLMSKAWQSFNGPVLLLLSGRDLTAQEFLELAMSAEEWRGTLNSPCVDRRDIASADHTFSRSEDRLKLESLCLDWLRINMQSKWNKKAPA